MGGVTAAPIVVTTEGDSGQITRMQTNIGSEPNISMLSPKRRVGLSGIFTCEERLDRKSVVEGKSGEVGGRRYI